LKEEIREKNIKEIEISKDRLSGSRKEVERNVIQILGEAGIALTFREVSQRSDFPKEQIRKVLESSVLIKKTSMRMAKDFFNFRKCPFRENPRTFLYYLERKDLESWARKHSYLL
jgi:hypothetical protein